MPQDRHAELAALIDKHWGFKTLRPLQQQAMQAVLADRDSLLVLPTGGGKSLCFQAPALLRNEPTIVVSPLIALMKDQVDALRAASVPARHVNSTLTESERITTFNELKAGKIRLLFASPERLMMPNFQQFLRQLGVRVFAIDEAHCISHWGHDFRPEYRQLSTLRELFPNAIFHGYTATATEQVRADIVKQLGLRNPAVLVGDFDRPNLCYRVLPRHRMLDQVVDILKRHANEAGIIYCIRRKDVDQLSADLNALGYRAMPYHAGMEAEDRKAAQDAFRSERCDLIVATVAFGMGIDRSNVRFVLHTGMPKSVEHYQQEAGRAGRDGLEAECILLHSFADFKTWQNILQKSAEENAVDADFLPNAMAHLEEINSYCRGAVCRHRVLVEHFGQKFAKPTCQACDLCLGEVDLVPQGQEIARKILSCVARLQERFGVNYVVSVLRGENSEKIERNGHDKLSTFGLLKEYAANQLRDWTHQLIDQELLEQAGDEYPILKLNEPSWEVMRNQRQVTLRQTEKRARLRKTAVEADSWEGVDHDLFEKLRTWRRETADAKGWPAFAVFSDNTLRDLARVRPSTLEKMRSVSGIGAAKLESFGEDVLAIIVPFCKEQGIALDQSSQPATIASYEEPLSPSALAYFPQFREGKSIEEIAHQSNRSIGTVSKYLCSYITQEKPASIDAWVPTDLQVSIRRALQVHGNRALRPLFDELGGKVSYEMIRIVLTFQSMILQSKVAT